MLLVWLVVCVAWGARSSYRVESSAQGSSFFAHRWEESVGSGHAALSLRADWRSALKQTSQELGFKRVRFHGLFDDDMSVALSTGISFYNIDASFDYIFSLGMSPLVELSFTPTLYKTTNGTIFNYQANISPPKLANWTNLISLFAQHLLERYGSGVVHSLFFEVWNEYNCGFLDSQTPEESYFELYKATFQALKSMDPKLAVGGPVTCMGLIDPFISYLAEHPEVSVDFISTHVYPTDPNVTDGEIRFLINNTVKTVEMSKLSVPVFFTEFNDGLFNNPPMHDFPYAASYFVKQMSRIDATLPLGGVPLMSWWTFTDVFEEDGMPAQEFDKPTSTGWGLLSSSGIEKPVYRAFQLLHQAGNTRHAVTAQGSIHPDSELLAVSDDSGYMMIFAVNNHWPTSKTSAANLTFSIQISSVTSSLSMSMTRIDDENANAPQLWRNDGRPLYLKEAAIQRYRAASQLSYSTVVCQLSGGSTCTIPDFVVPVNGLAVFRFKY